VLHTYDYIFGKSAKLRYIVTPEGDCDGTFSTLSRAEEALAMQNVNRGGAVLQRAETYSAVF
jgi:hypothetical protein